jgi:hypothetical protein
MIFPASKGFSGSTRCGDEFSPNYQMKLLATNRCTDTQVSHFS